MKKKFAGAAGLLPNFFLSVSHNTASCIVTQGLTSRAWETGLGEQQARRGAHGWPQYGRLGHHTTHDMTKGGNDMAGSSRARGLAGGKCVTIQSLYRDRSEGLAGWGWVTIQSIVS